MNIHNLLVKVADHFIIDGMEMAVIAVMAATVRWLWVSIKKVMIPAKRIVSAISEDTNKRRRIVRLQLMIDGFVLLTSAWAVVALLLDSSPVSKQFVFIMCLLFLAIANTWVQLDLHLTDYRNHK